MPIEVRRALGLVSGMPVEFVVREGEAVLRKGRSAAHPVDEVYGKLVLPAPVDRLIDEMRGPRPRGPARRRPPRPRGRRS